MVSPADVRAVPDEFWRRCRESPGGAGGASEWAGVVARRLGGPGLGLRVEEPLAPPAADEAGLAEQAALGRDRLSVSVAETEERDGRRVVDRVGGAVLAPGW